ncbi:unnamed protein product [Bursaphelenchus xylophilus]|uniref:Carboxylic ester hydrolase n=1 Tax=Bursaphelenchus xylophilus TaxID=6326 RepID=A0A1I7RLB4_BURXY|nr:unnamed protein product [Bursaphelenchus xylophilus]CAG9083203.1 unnamed protein product [Bursaphelenchus xylophilus]
MSDKIRIRFGNGEVEGKRIEGEAAAFLGIPYAQPPVGELRFQKPKPVKNWDGVKDCTEFGAHCPYKATHTDRITGSDEDCLYLNVFAPISNSQVKKNLPVFVYIHGGGFVMDCSNKLGIENIGRHLCIKDIIVVTLNYRLGLLGFLCWNDKIKGNFGLYDMKMALEWVVRNISAFGGDPHNITVGGQSAGAVAVDLLSLSPLTRDLFQNCINFAGTSFCVFATKDQSKIKEFAIDFAKKHLRYQGDGEDDKVLEILKTADCRDLAIEGLANLGPVLDGEFFPKDLDALREEAPRKNVLTGVTEYECLTFGIFSQQFPTLKASVPFFVRLINETIDVKPAEDLYDKFVDETLDEKDPEKYKQFTNFLSDLYFNYGTYRMVKHRVERGEDVYQFRFTYFKEGTNGSYASLIPFQGASHCLELPYLFGISYIDEGEFEPDENDKIMIDYFSGYLINFIKNGNPNDEKLNGWEKVTKENLAGHMCFDLEPKMHNVGLYSSQLHELDAFFKQ